MAQTKKKILLIDDEPDITELIQFHLEQKEYIVKTAADGLKGIKIAREFMPDLILLDVMMPEMDGIEVCQLLKEDSKTKNILICFLSARSEDYSQIAGLDAGADDYVTKPIKPKVLLSRIKALLRRSSETHSETQNSKLIIIPEKYIVKKDGIKIHLPRKEFELLSLLSSKPDHVFNREVILNTVWGSDIIVGDRTIDVHIRKLRSKIGAEHIQTIKGVGYKFMNG
ncbi:MAG: DNA-binding response regulator [Crocinitomicaceae bacterium]|nr:DNA-binding response regulator [Crocinitomicaceae bacterium]|tara:strand:+ start:679 stop:1356 length:678 start_codon:yes stop_codon:yes gene_type:complete